MTRFDKFVIEQDKKKTEFNPEMIISQFRERIETLYAEIDRWLQKYIPHQIQTGVSEIEITEERLGTYMIHEKWIQIGNDRVLLRPAGTLMIGTPARVDIKCRVNQVMLVLIGKNIEHFSQVIRFEIKGDPKLKREEPGELVWKFVNPKTRETYRLLTKETFETTLMDLING